MNEKNQWTKEEFYAASLAVKRLRARKAVAEVKHMKPNDVFHKVTIRKQAGFDARRNRLVEAECECGEIFQVRESTIRFNYKTSGWVSCKACYFTAGGWKGIQPTVADRLAQNKADEAMRARTRKAQAKATKPNAKKDDGLPTLFERKPHRLLRVRVLDDYRFELAFEYPQYERRTYRLTTAIAKKVRLVDKGWKIYLGYHGIKTAYFMFTRGLIQFKDIESDKASQVVG